jgi:hypothetical protein
MAGKKKTGRRDVGKFADDDYDAKEDSYEDSDDDLNPKTGGYEEDKDGDENNEDDNGPKSVRQPQMKNKLDLM